MNEITKRIPTLDELIKGDEQSENALTVILNQNPPKQWLKDHPTAKVKNDEGKFTPVRYIPRERVEFMLTRIYKRWWLEIKDIKLIANSPTVVVRLHVINPVTGLEEWQDGVGASPIQTDSGAGAIEFDKMKNAAVMMAAPAAETFAFKDAAEKFGKLFGKDLNVMDIDYSSLLKQEEQDEQIKDGLKLCNDMEELHKYIEGLPKQIQNSLDFRNLVVQRKKEISLQK